MPEVIEAVLFDLDGTLADTAPDMARTVNRMLEKRGRPAVGVEQVRPFVSRGARGMIVSAFNIAPEDPGFQELREEFLAIYPENLCVDTRLFAGMEEVLGLIESRGMKWGVVTNKFERFAVPLLADLDLAHRMAVVVGGDTCPRPKPFPDPLLHAAATMGVAPMHTLYVGDDERDVRAARAAGMPVVVAGYGYLGDGPPPSLWGADAVVDSCETLRDWIVERLPVPPRQVAR